MSALHIHTNAISTRPSDYLDTILSDADLIEVISSADWTTISSGRSVKAGARVLYRKFAQMTDTTTPETSLAGIAPADSGLLHHLDESPYDVRDGAIGGAIDLPFSQIASGQHIYVNPMSNAFVMAAKAEVVRLLGLGFGGLRYDEIGAGVLGAGQIDFTDCMEFTSRADYLRAWRSFYDSPDVWPRDVDGRKNFLQFASYEEFWDATILPIVLATGSLAGAAQLAQIGPNDAIDSISSAQMAIALTGMARAVGMLATWRKPFNILIYSDAGGGADALAGFEELAQMVALLGGATFLNVDPMRDQDTGVLPNHR